MSVPDDLSDVVPPTVSLVGRFFRHGATYAVAGIFSQGIAFLLFPFFAHVFLPRDYGIIDLIALVTTLVNLTIALEISQGLGRYFVEAKEFDERQAYASTALVFTVAVYTLGLAVSLIAIEPLTDLVLGDGVDTKIMSVGVAAIWCSGMLYLTQSLLRWELRPKAFAAVSVVTATVTALASAILVLGFDTGVIGAIAGQLFGFAAGAVLAYSLSLKLFRFRFDAAKFHSMVAYSLPLVPASIGVFLNGYADRIAIRSQRTLADVGLYGVGYRLSIIVSLVLLGFQGALLPLVLSHHEEPQTRRDLARIFRLFCAIALAVFLCVSLFADELLRILTQSAYYSAADVIPLLIAASFLAGMYVFAPGPSIAKQTRPYLVVAVLSGIVNAALAFWLVEPLGIRGPALAFLIASAGSFIALMIFSQRLYLVPHDWGNLLITGSVITILVTLGRTFLGGAPDALTTLSKVAVTAVGLAVIAVRLLTREERLELVRLPLRSARTLRSFQRRVRPRRRGRHA